jgi:hypothetical protein
MLARSVSSSAATFGQNDDPFQRPQGTVDFGETPIKAQQRAGSTSCLSLPPTSATAHVPPTIQPLQATSTSLAKRSRRLWGRFSAAWRGATT